MACGLCCFKEPCRGINPRRTAIVRDLFKIKNNKPESWSIFHLHEALYKCSPSTRQFTCSDDFFSLIKIHKLLYFKLSLPFFITYNIKFYYDYILILHITFLNFVDYNKYFKYLIILDFVSNYGKIYALGFQLPCL